MRFLQTYYSFSTDEDPMFDKAGFLSPEFHWITMAISCLLLKQHYGHVTLYCNSTAKKVVEELCIPYDQIVTIPNIMAMNYGLCQNYIHTVNSMNHFYM